MNRKTTNVPLALGRIYADRWYMILCRATLANAYAQGFRRGFKAGTSAKNRRPSR